MHGELRKGSSGDRLRVLVLADIHHFAEPFDDHSPSHLTLNPGRSGRRDPFSDLNRLFERESPGRIDLVLCAGDLAHQAQPDALRACWERLNALATQLGAQLIATAGNHDLDSRAGFDVSPKSQLLELEPPFPAGQEEYRLSYWAYDFALVRTDRYRVISLNSCALHGYGGVEQEYEHGRFHRTTGRFLAQALAEDGPAPEFSILVVHHHLVQLPGIDLADASVMLDSQELIERLMESGSWLVVHGHKHRPYTLYAPGGGGAPAVFSAGSFSATPTGELGAHAGNQAYLLELQTRDELEPLELGLGLTFRSWTWDPTIGWGDSGLWPHGGLPGRGGLGWRIDPHWLATRIQEFVMNLGGEASVIQLFEWEPRFPYLSPPDLGLLGGVLANLVPPLEIQFDPDGSIRSIVLLRPAITGSTQEDGV